MLLLRLFSDNNIGQFYQCMFALEDQKMKNAHKISQSSTFSTRFTLQIVASIISINCEEKYMAKM